jgi:RNA polymerase sigma-70 factor (ECF subfamily)
MDSCDRQTSGELRERFSLLWIQAEPAVSAYVFAAVQQFQDAEDIVQQVALAAARRFDEYDGRRPFIGWVLWLAKSRIIDHYRARDRQKLVFSERLLDQVATRFVERHEEGEHAGSAALERCIEKLPAKSRRLLDLRYVEDAPIDLIARTINSTGGSVRVMLFRIRELLANCIREEMARDVP